MYTVGIGASSGGFEALIDFFSNVKKNDEISYILIRHLKRDHVSEMPRLIKKYTSLNTSRIKNGTIPEANHIHVMPEDTKVVSKNGVLYLEKRPEKEIINKAIDHFFFSLAKDARERAVGVILSGTGNDGAKGAKAITNIGGMVMVQSPDSTMYKGMPESAIKADHPTFILNPTEMYEQLEDYIHERAVREYESRRY